MSREIKFRAWDIREKRMIYADEAKNSKTVLAVGFHGLPIAIDSGSFRDNEIIGWNVDHYLTLMQYIGIKDHKGTEIYECDIVKIGGATAQIVFWEHPPEFGLNYYHNEDAWCEDWNLTDDYDRMEIIGNVYEHPHLLNIVSA